MTAQKTVIVALLLHADVPVTSAKRAKMKHMLSFSQARQPQEIYLAKVRLSDDPLSSVSVEGVTTDGKPLRMRRRHHHDGEGGRCEAEVGGQT